MTSIAKRWSHFPNYFRVAAFSFHIMYTRLVFTAKFPLAACTGIDTTLLSESNELKNKRLRQIGDGLIKNGSCR